MKETSDMAFFSTAKPPFPASLTYSLTFRHHANIKNQPRYPLDKHAPYTINYQQLPSHCIIPGTLSLHRAGVLNLHFPSCTATVIHPIRVLTTKDSLPTPQHHRGSTTNCQPEPHTSIEPPFLSLSLSLSILRSIGNLALFSAACRSLIPLWECSEIRKIIP